MKRRHNSDDVLDLTADEAIGELLDRREDLRRIEARAEAARSERREIDDRLAERLGNSGAGRAADGRLIAVRRVHRPAYKVGPTNYRVVTVEPGDA